MDTKDTKVERGSDNVFTDLGQPDPDAHLLKAELVTRIDEIIRRRGLKQVEAAKLLGLSQPDVSRLLRGSFREYSIERLLRLLTALGRDAVEGDLTRYLDRAPDESRLIRETSCRAWAGAANTMSRGRWRGLPRGCGRRSDGGSPVRSRP